MAKDQTVGLLLLDDLLEWTALQKGREGPSVLDTCRLALETPPEDADAEELEGAVPVDEQVRAGCAGINAPVRLAIPSDQLLLRVVPLPPLEPDELAGTIELQVDKLSPFPVETMVVSHEVLRQDEESMLVLIAAVQTRVVKDLGDQLQRTGIAVHGVDAALMGWWCLLRAADGVPETGRHVLLLLDRENTPEVIVTQDGVPVLFRTIALSGEDESEMAKELAREVGFSMLSLELEHGVCAERSVTVWGRGDIPEAITTNLHEQCECAVATESLDELPPRTEGIARRSLDDTTLDLTPPEWSEKETTKRFKKRVLLSSGAFFGIWLMLVLGFLGGVYYQERLLHNLEDERGRWELPAQEVSDIRRRVRVIREYADQEHSSLECLRELALNQPEGVELTSFTYRKSELVKVVGEAGTVAQVYEFKNKLDESTLFEETRLNGPRYEPRRKKQIFDMDLKMPGDGEEESE